jgi:hypothetical protein
MTRVRPEGEEMNSESVRWNASSSAQTMTNILLTHIQEHTVTPHPTQATQNEQQAKQNTKDTFPSFLTNF